MPDRIEAGTYLILGAASNGAGLTGEELSNVWHLKSLNQPFKEILDVI